MMGLVSSQEEEENRALSPSTRGGQEGKRDVCKPEERSRQPLDLGLSRVQNCKK